MKSITGMNVRLSEEEPISRQLEHSEPITEALIRALLARYEINEGYLQSEFYAMDARTNYLKDLNTALGALRVKRPNAAEAAASDYGKFYSNSEGRMVDVAEFAKKNNIAIKGERGTQADFDAAINNIKAAVDGANAEAQLELFKLQRLLDKRSQLIELASSIAQRAHRVSELIIGNLR